MRNITTLFFTYECAGKEKNASLILANTFLAQNTSIVSNPKAERIAFPSIAQKSITKNNS